MPAKRNAARSKRCSAAPPQRSEIVWGKLLTVMTFSMATALLNLRQHGGDRHVRHRATAENGRPAACRWRSARRRWLALVWLVLALVPISALFSALSLAVAAFARSSKEGQYYLMPLLLVTLPLMMLPMLPGSELDLGNALIPITGVMLLLAGADRRAVLRSAAIFGVPVVGVTAACCLLAIRWAVDQFNNESVLFRESERLDLGRWLRHLVRDREDTPTAGEAIFCGVLILVIRFFAELRRRRRRTTGMPVRRHHARRCRSR